MEKSKGRDNSICEQLAYKKGLQKFGTDRQIRRQGRAFEHYFGPRGWEFEQSHLQKFKCQWFARGRDVEILS